MVRMWDLKDQHKTIQNIAKPMLPAGLVICEHDQISTHSIGLISAPHIILTDSSLSLAVGSKQRIAMWQHLPHSATKINVNTNDWDYPSSPTHQLHKACVASKCESLLLHYCSLYKWCMQVATPNQRPLGHRFRSLQTLLVLVVSNCCLPRCWLKVAKVRPPNPPFHWQQLGCLVTSNCLTGVVSYLID